MDSIVRSEARRLRRKLNEYYESVGKDDPVSIDYRRGSYVPAFQNQRRLRDNCIGTDRTLGERFMEKLGTQDLDIPLVARKVDVQIVFEGTVRVLRPGSRSSRSGLQTRPNTSKRKPIRKVVSMSLGKSRGR